MKMFLDTDEVRELTDKSRYTSQVKVLRAMGIEHRTRPDGSIAVLRSHVEQIMSGGGPARRRPDAEPNWGALHAARA